MPTILATIVLCHFAALAGVLLFTRYSAMAVDEQGRPLTRDPWEERVVASNESPTPASLL